MSRQQPPSLVVTVDEQRGIAPVRGRSARRVTQLLAAEQRQWSPSGRGWVVPADVVADLRTFAEIFRGELCVVSQRKQAAS
jgi:hypothetical protein